ncbi:MAG: hypothetical protein IJG70_02775, partial [Kiritimatiellae bacterium]|nr:hypothetical protein [Kiritimatiellia bacterium]
MNPKKAKTQPKTQKQTSSATVVASTKAAARQRPAARSVGDLAAQAEAEHRAWLRKYLPVEQRILAERERLFER